VRHQIHLLQARPDLTGGCPIIIGLIVHRRRLHARSQASDDPRVYRCTMQALGNLLLASRAAISWL
jgi:hypothetical protein